MHTKEEIIVKNLYSCPLTKQIFCHPVLASDGFHYELIALLNSPTTLEPITHIQYDLKLKNTIDETTNDDQFTFYEKEHPLNELIKTLQNNQNAWKQSAYEVSRVSFSVLNVLILLDVAMVYVLSPYFIILMTILSALLELGARFITNHRYGFFEGSAVILNEFPACLERIAAEEIRFA